MPLADPDHSGGQHLMLYDGVCGLCNQLNQFVLRRDAAGRFDFAPLQSRVGRDLLARFNRDPQALDTLYIVLNYRGASPQLLSKAEAVLFAMRALGAPWRWLAILGSLPRRLLDRGYDLIARHRYRMFGRSERCILPAAKDAGRFLDLDC